MFVWTRGLREYIASTLGIVTIDIEGVGSTTRGFNNQCAPRFVTDGGPQVISGQSYHHIKLPISVISGQKIQCRISILDSECHR